MKKRPLRYKRVCINGCFFVVDTLENVYNPLGSTSGACSLAGVRADDLNKGENPEKFLWATLTHKRGPIPVNVLESWHSAAFQLTPLKRQK